jgi:glutathione peroxidase
MREHIFHVLSLVVLAVLVFSTPIKAGQQCPDYLNQNLLKLHSQQTLNICEKYAGKPLLIVNTASHCGFTPQFSGLEKLYKQYKDKGLVVLGFPSNDFDRTLKRLPKFVT